MTAPLFTVNPASPQANGLIAWFAGADPTDNTKLFDSAVTPNHGSGGNVSALTYLENVGRPHAMQIINGFAVPDSGPARALLPPFTVTGWCYTAFSKNPYAQISVMLPFGVAWNAFFQSPEGNSSLATAINTVFTVTGALPWVFNKWQHFALRFNSTSSREYFQDGVNAGTPDTVNQPLACYLDLGGGNQNPPHGLYGYLDDVRVYNRALTDAEILATAKPGERLLLYKNVDTLANGLIHYWKLDEMGAGTRADSVGSNALTVAGTTVNAVGKVLGGFDTNNANAYLQGAQVDLSNKSWTVAGWIQAYGLDTTGSDSCILFSQGNAGLNQHEWGIRWSVYYDGGSIQLEYFPGSYVNTNMVIMPVPLDQSGTVWNFVCARYDLATQTMRLRWNNTDATPKVVVNPVTSFGSPLQVGQLTYASTVYRSQARIDELAIYDRSLTDFEVSSLLAAPGLPGIAAQPLTVGFYAH